MSLSSQADGAASDGRLMRLVHRLTTQAITHGAGYLLVASSPAGPYLRALDSRYVYPTHEGGWVVTEPMVGPGARTQTPDSLMVTTVGTDGAVMVATRAGTPTGTGYSYGVGPFMSAGRLGEGMILPVLALPEQAEVWGTSWFDDLMTLAIQKARRMASNTKVLDENSDPLLLMQGDLDRYTMAPGVPPSTASASPSDIQREHAVASRLRQGGKVIMPSGVENARYVTWDGSLGDSIAMLGVLDNEFRFMSGIPAALNSEGPVPSGMSLRRMFWQFDASVAPLYRGIYAVLTRALAAHGLPFEWPNTFEAVTGTPTEAAREDVPDEETARRGEGDDPEEGDDDPEE